MTRTADGDHEAFAALFDLLAPRTLGLLIQILRRRCIAEEVLQDVFLQVWKQAANHSPERGSVRSWIVMIARSRALDRIRRERSAHGLEDPLTEKQEAGWTMLPAQPARAIGKENQQRLLDSLGTLTSGQRDCMELALFQGLSHSQIAFRLSAPLGTVKSRLRMGMEKLQNRLSGKLKRD